MVSRQRTYWTKSRAGGGIPDTSCHVQDLPLYLRFARGPPTTFQILDSHTENRLPCYPT